MVGMPPPRRLRIRVTVYLALSLHIPLPLEFVPRTLEASLIGTLNEKDLGRSRTRPVADRGPTFGTTGIATFVV